MSTEYAHATNRLQPTGKNFGVLPESSSISTATGPTKVQPLAGGGGATGLTLKYNVPERNFMVPSLGRVHEMTRHTHGHGTAPPGFPQIDDDAGALPHAIDRTIQARHNGSHPHVEPEQTNGLVVRFEERAAKRV
jgi:hypothetical protein